MLGAAVCVGPHVCVTVDVCLRVCVGGHSRVELCTLACHNIILIRAVMCMFMSGAVLSEGSAAPVRTSSLKTDLI